MASCATWHPVSEYIITVTLSIDFHIPRIWDHSPKLYVTNQHTNGGFYIPLCLFGVAKLLGSYFFHSTYSVLLQQL